MLSQPQKSSQVVPVDILAPPSRSNALKPRICKCFIILIIIVVASVTFGLISEQSNNYNGKEGKY